jgi:hypothetical protein
LFHKSIKTKNMKKILCLGLLLSSMVGRSQKLTLTAMESCDSMTQGRNASGNVWANASGGTAPYSYRWSNGSSQATNAGVPNGTYSVAVYDANGDTADATVTVNCPFNTGGSQNLSLNVIPACDSIPSNNSGSVWAFVSGGTFPYSFVWSNGLQQSSGSTLSVDSGLTNGTYAVTVYDANGYTANATVTVNCPPSSPYHLDTIVHITTQINCNGYGIYGGITASATGGVSPYFYAWSTGDTTATVQYLTNGTYTVYVFDSNGNVSFASVTLNCANQTDSTYNNCTPPTVSYVIIPDDSIQHLYFLYPNYSQNVVNATWYWGDGTSTNGLWAGHAYATGGWYNICVTVHNLCGDSASFCMNNDSIFRMSSNNSIVNVKVKQSVTTGINETAVDNKTISVYPNPSRGAVTISYELAHSTPVRLSVYDILGNKIMDIENQNKLAGAYQIPLNTDQLNAGMYFIRLSSEGQLTTTRIVVTK